MNSLHFAPKRQRVWLASTIAILVLLIVGAAPVLAQSGTEPNPTILGTVTCPTTLSSCTANDVGVTVVKAVPVPGEVCTDPQDTILVDLTVNFAPNAERYDIGVFYATDGGTIPQPNPTAQSCVGGVAPISGGWPQPGNVFWDIDASGPPHVPDACGDLKSKNNYPNNAGVNWTVRTSVRCVPDANNNLVVNSCSVWTQSKDSVCTDVSSIVAGTGSKCYCDSLVFDLPQDVPFGATVTVNKVVVPAADTGKFNLQIDGSTKGTGGNVGNGGTTGPVSVSAGTAASPGATHTIGETAAGTGTSLDDYNSSISCTCTGTGTPGIACPSPATVGPFDGTSLPLTVNRNQNWVCTITNHTATITVDKITNPAGASKVFDYTLTGTPDNASAESFTLTHSQTPVSIKVRPGTIVSNIANSYTVTELGETDWTLTAASCVIRGGGSVGTPSVLPGASGAGGSVSSIPITAGQIIDCTFTNTAGALSVTLSSFQAEQVADYVQVTWETVSELNNRGFNLYRATSAAGPYTQLNTTLIPSQSQGSPSGFVYTWEDRAGLVAGTDYFYQLEDLDIGGATTMHGPVSVSYVGPTAVGVSAVQANPAAGAAALPWLWAAAAAGAALGVSRLRRRS